MRRQKSRLVAVAATLVAALALTGCVKLDEDLTINADNTVDGTVTVAFNKAMLDMMGATADDALGETGGMLEGADVNVEAYDDGTFVGQTYTLDGAPLDQLNGGDSDMQIVRDGDEFHVTGTLDLSDSTVGGDVSVPTDGFEVRIALTFPGEIVSSTGEVDGNTVTWTPELGDVVDFETVAKAEGGGGAGAGAGLLAAGGLGLTALAAGGVGVVMVQRRKRAPGSATATTAELFPGAAPADAPFPTTEPFPGMAPFPATEPFPAGVAGPADAAATGPWSAPAPEGAADSWSTPYAAEPRPDVDAAPPAAVPFDPTGD